MLRRIRPAGLAARLLIGCLLVSLILPLWAKAAWAARAASTIRFEERADLRVEADLPSTNEGSSVRSLTQNSPVLTGGTAHSESYDNRLAANPFELFLPFVSVGAAPYPGALSFPYGPFYLPTNLFGSPYTGALQSLGLFSTVSMLDSARAAGLHLIVNLSGGRVSFQKPDGSFDLLAWEALVANFAGVIEPYIADGTIVGHLMIDEPQDPSNWNGLAVPCADIEAAAVYSKSLWPDMQAGAGTHATWIAAQPCNWSAFDFTLTPYTSKWGSATDFMNANITAAQSVGIKYYASINVEIGGALGAEVTAAELQSWGNTFIGNTNVCGLTLWQYSDAYFTRADIVPVLADLGAQAAARGPCP